jgi:parallel beta-helix repeat protein
MNRKAVLILVFLLFLFLHSCPIFEQNEAKATDGYPVHNLNTGLNYTTIQEAIDANETLDGHTLRIDQGTYLGNVTIYKSLSLIGFDRDTTIVNGLNTGSVFRITADNVKISGFTIRNGTYGMTLYRVTNVTITNTTISNNNWAGINMLNSDYNIIADNVIENTSVYEGIYVLGNSNKIENNSIRHNEYGFMVSNSFGNVVCGNEISDNGFINLELWYSWSTTVSNNNLSRSRYGIFQHRAVNDTIFGNDIVNNTYFGILVEEPGGGTRIFHNNFVNNYDSASISPLSNSTWDDGYPSGGNCWSDYNGTDGDNDGIGDTPYVLGENNIDHYPLMNPWAPPDLAVADIPIAKTVIGGGYAGTVIVTFENQGNKIEASNLTVYANSTLIYSEEVLLKMANRTVSIGLDTTVMAYGNYTMTAFAEPLPEETDTADNNFTCSVPVHIGVPGDISGPTPGVYDGTTNMRDINYLILRFNSKPDSPNWNPNADVNNDRTVNMRDIQIAILHFNQHE